MVVNIPVLIDGSTETSLKSGVYKALSCVKSDWHYSDLKFHVYSTGLSNKLVGIWKEDATDQILVRVSGNNTEKFIDRENEAQAMELLYKHGCGPKLYGKFENGLVYSFIPGRPLTEDCINIDEIWVGIAQAIATIHQIKIEEKESQLFPRLRLFFKLLPLNFKEEQSERLQSHGISRDFLMQEITELESILVKLNCPTVLSHNDVLLQNIIWNEKIKKVSLIDFEYTFVNYQPFDIGNHFNEFAGVETVDYNRYPSSNYQRKWIRMYLSHYSGRAESDIEENEIETMRVWANKFALVSHIFWGIWALLQSHFSPLDFDFTGYALIRLCEYKNRKEEFLSMKLPSQSK